MAQHFTSGEWQKINTLLQSEGERFGLPARRSKSVVMASFNIRKIGNIANKSEQAWSFLQHFCERCDFIAIQEVQDDLSALNHLRGKLGTIGKQPRYGMVASDITGWSISAKRSMVERLAFLYRWDRVERTEVCSDLTFDRTELLNSLFSGRVDFWQDLENRVADLAAWEQKNIGKSKKSKKPAFVLSNFLSFIRTPLCTSFRIKGETGSVPYEFLAINAHLLYGEKNKQKHERELEFYALLSWLTQRARKVNKLYHKNMILLGDLNLDFTKTDARRTVIENKIKALNSGELSSPNSAMVNFPFFSVHKDHAQVFRSTARLTETYDQIAFFNHDKRLPKPEDNATAGATKDGFNYGVFNFSDLFAEAIHGKPMAELTPASRKKLIAKYEHDVSDHLPIWVRLPRPKKAI
ncbi:MAG: hypothetical protein KUG75_13845 [Pseudomonadales bacterium]|nr:hypothetical protein [Pseudomonadales bacterium]